VFAGGLVAGSTAGVAPGGGPGVPDQGDLVVLQPVQGRDAVREGDAGPVGVGVAIASKPLIEAEVTAGRLVVPFDIVIRRTQAYYLVAPEAIADRPIVNTFRRWLRSEAATVAEE